MRNVIALFYFVGSENPCIYSVPNRKQSYEYTVREDILMSLEFHDLPNAQANALLKSPSPLADVFKEWESKENGYMEDIWQTVDDRAKEAVKREAKKEQKER